MSSVGQLEEVLALALQLAPKERLQLIEKVAASVERDIEAVSGSPDETWGQKLVRMMDEGGPIEMIHPEIEDATEWVKQIRWDQDERRGLKWDDNQ